MKEIKQEFTTPDGKVFEYKIDALKHLNRQKVEKTLKVNEEVIKKIFNAGTPTGLKKKTEKKQLIEALETVKEELNNNKTKFLVENAEAIVESFHRYLQNKKH